MSAPTTAAAIISRIPKWVWVLLALAVLFLLLRNPLRRLWFSTTNVLRRDQGNYTEGFQAPPGETDARRAELEAMAAEAYAQLNAAIPSPSNRQAALDTILNQTNDFELRRVANHYKSLSRDKSLYQAIDDAWMPFTDVDERLMARLSRINLR